MNKQFNLKYLTVLILILTLLLAGCGQETVASSVSSETSDYQSSIQDTEMPEDIVLESIDPNAFIIDMNEEGVPVMTGTLLPEVTLNARLYAPEDINHPGTGSVDVASIRAFSPNEVDLLYQDNWEVISDTSDQLIHETGAEYDAVWMECVNESGEIIKIGNTYRGVSLENSWRRSPERIPWYSTDYPWQFEDFDFMSAEEAYALWYEQMAMLGVDLSSIYKVDRVPYAVFDAYYRLNLSYGMEDLLDIEWSEDNNAYYLSGSQDWNGFSVLSEGVFNFFNGLDFEGDEYRGTLFTDLDVIVSSQGIQSLNCFYVFEMEREGEEMPLISLWDALETLRVHILNPVYEGEILYNLSLNPNNIVIDQIELCYVPVRQGRLGVAEDSLYEMVPCWSFRLIVTEHGFEQVYTALVHAITNEYILQTAWSEGPA